VYSKEYTFPIFVVVIIIIITITAVFLLLCGSHRTLLLLKQRSRRSYKLNLCGINVFIQIEDIYKGIYSIFISILFLVSVFIHSTVLQGLNPLFLYDKG
jgi:hypothetical protein